MRDLKKYKDNWQSVISSIDSEAIQKAVIQYIAKSAEHNHTESEIYHALHKLVDMVIYEYEVESIL